MIRKIVAVVFAIPAVFCGLQLVLNATQYVLYDSPSAFVSGVYYLFGFALFAALAAVADPDSGPDNNTDQSPAE